MSNTNDQSIGLTTKEHDFDYCGSLDYSGIKSTFQGGLLQKYFNYRGPIDDLLNSFDQLITELPSILSSKPLIIKSNTGSHREVVFLHPQFRKPHYIETGNAYTLYPEHTRNNHKTYACNVSATPYMFLVDKKGNRKLEATGDPVDIIRLPVMLKSKLCNLYGITDPVKLMELGEDPDDQGGYFIINGNSRVVVNIDKLQLNKIFVLPSKTGIQSRITIPTPSGTKLVVVTTTSLKSLHLQLGIFRKSSEGKTNTMNVINIIEIIDNLYLNDQISKEIGPNAEGSVYISWVREQLRMYAKSVSQWSKMLSIFSITEAEYSGIPRDNAVRTLTEHLGVAESSLTDQKQKLDEVFHQQLFPNISKNDMRTKIDMLIIMCVRLLLHHGGFYPVDDKNSWSNKKLESPGKVIAIEFRGLIRNTLSIAQKEITPKNYQRIPQIVNAIRFDNLSDGLIRAFVNPSYGGKSTYARQSMTDPFDADNIIDGLSHLTKIDTVVDRNVKSLEVRGVQSTQLGYICPSETPDTNACGIVKNKALTAYITGDESSAGIVALMLANEYLYKYPTDGYSDYVLVNGIYHGWSNAELLYTQLVQARRQGLISKYTSVISSPRGYLEVFTDAGRLVRPLLVVGDNGKLEIHNHGAEDMSFEELIRHGYVEFVSPGEAENMTIAPLLSMLDERLDNIKNIATEIRKVQSTDDGNLNSLNMRYQQELKPYHYAELHPVVISGIATSLIPFMNFNQSCRVSYQAKMFKQAMSIKSTNPYRFSGNTKQMASPSTSLVRTVLDNLLGIDTHPIGETVNLAIFSYTGYTQEDAFVINLASVQRGVFRYYKEIVYDTRLVNTSDFTQELARPSTGNEGSETYRYINENGLPSIGAVLQEGDCVIGKVQHNSFDGSISNVSEKINVGDYGVVEDVRVVNDNKGTYIAVKLRSFHSPRKGDKYAPRYAQKGTIGVFIDDVDMPYDPITGMRPDIIMNPHAIPSRMTMGLIREMVLGTSAALEGRVYDATAFQGYDDRKFRQVLLENGFSSMGKSQLVNPKTAEIIECPIYTGLTYFQQLSHLVEDKYQARGRGRRNATTGQATRGRKNQGGLKLGAMEVHAALSHGAAFFIQERLCTTSDAYTTSYCISCGVIANYNSLDDKFVCDLCGGQGEIGKITIPFVYKYLIQILASAGMLIKSDLIKEDDRVKMMEKKYQQRQLQASSELTLEGNDESDEELNRAIEEQEDMPMDDLDYFDVDIEM